MKPVNTDYPLIPLTEITAEAREIAVRWGEFMDDNFIIHKHKLASDIMNYARRYHEREMEKLARKTEVSNNTIPEWITRELRVRVIELWTTENINHSNPRSSAIKLLQAAAKENGYGITIQKAMEIIKLIIQ